MSHRFYWPGMWWLASAAMLSTPVLAGDSPVSLHFVLQAGKQALSCNGPALPLGQPGHAARLKDAKFYLSDIRLLREDGHSEPLQLIPDPWQSHDVALLDFVPGGGSCGAKAVGQVNDTVRGQLPAGRYTGLSFTIGVPLDGQDGTGKAVALNHGNFELAEAPLDRASMAWSWQVGRKFIKLELFPEGGMVRSNGRAAVWTLHLGSTGCTGNPAQAGAVQCLSSNRVPVMLPDFDPERDRVVIDVASLLADSHLTEDKGGASGCMSSIDDPECRPLFRQLQLQLEPGERRGLPLLPLTSPSFVRVDKP